MTAFDVLFTHFGLQIIEAQSSPLPDRSTQNEQSPTAVSLRIACLAAFFCRQKFSNGVYFFAFFLGVRISSAFLVSETRMKTVASMSSELP